MPNIPNGRSLNASSVDILNAIRNNATANYQSYVPVANNSVDSVRAIGSIIMDYPALQNEFLSALVNRIGRVLITSKMFANPWAVFKKGILEYGETVEEIFVNIAEPFAYDTAAAESNVFKRNIPDVRAAFHILDYRTFYKQTIQDKNLKQAFLSWNGVTNLIAGIVDSMYSGASYDEFLTMKYMLGKNILNGRLKPVEIAGVSAANAKSIVSTIKGISNDFTFPTNKYNAAKVYNKSEKSRQYLIVNSKFDALIDVEVLATAFNMEKAEFMGKVILVDDFGNLDDSRLAKIFEKDSEYVPFTSAEKTALSSIPCVLVDEDYFMIFDNLMEFTENYNGEGLYWNYWYHVWKTYSTSPFANAALFVAGTPSVTSVTVSPETATVGKGQSVDLTATVVTANFAPQSVTWSSNNDDVTVDIYGKVTVSPDATTADTATITATSTFDSTKSDTATITVG